MKVFFDKIIYRGLVTSIIDAFLTLSKNVNVINDDIVFFFLKWYKNKEKPL